MRTALTRLPPQTRLHVVYVVDHALAMRYQARIKASLHEGVVVLACAKALLEQHGRAGETSLIGNSEQAASVPEAIMHEADRWGAHLLVMGSRGRGALTRWMLGSVAERVLRESTRPVLVCPPASGAADAMAMHDTLEAEMKRAVEGGAVLPPIFL